MPVGHDTKAGEGRGAFVLPAGILWVSCLLVVLVSMAPAGAPLHSSS